MAMPPWMRSSFAASNDPTLRYAANPSEDGLAAVRAANPAPAAAPAQAAPATPAAPAAPAPAAPPTPAESQQRYWDRFGSGEDWANEHFADGVMGTIKDPRAAETQDLLDRQRNQLGGMTSEENRAAMDQGSSEISRQMAQNRERYAGIAGSQGVRGGANAALQNRAGMEANQQMADYQRKLILDNIAIKGQAMDRYGATLGQQQGVELGIGRENNDLRNAELYGRTSSPFQIASGIGAQEASDMSNYFGGKELELGERSLALIQAQTNPAAPAGSTPAGTNNIAGNTTAGASRDTKTRSNENMDAPTSLSAAGVTAKDPLEAKAKAKELYLQRYPEPDMGAFEANTAQNPLMNWAWERGYASPQDMPADLLTKGKEETADAMTKYNSTRGMKKNTIICTEAHRQGLFSDSDFRASRAYGAAKLTSEQYAAYITWATPVVAAMKTSPVLSKVVAACLNQAVKGMRAELRGSTAFTFGTLTLMKALNFVFRKAAARALVCQI